MPLVVYVHGGPGTDSTPIWPHAWPVDVLRTALASGYAVFLPNYRGGFGFGEAATRAIRGSVGRGDARDVLNGVDAVARLGTIDTRHIAIYGYSFGGSIALAASAQTHRFSAAVTGGAVTDWRSYSGEDGIDSELPFFGVAYYENPGVYDLASPLSYVRGARTPTLIMQGDADEEVPVSQPYEFWRALRAQGVPARLRIFHDEGHGYADPKNQALFSAEAVPWLNHHL